jgi:hypothetical protein
MAPYEKIVQRATESLYADERLRSNLTDDEAKVVLGWAAGRIADQINFAPDGTSATQIARDESTRVRQVLTALNTLAKKPGALRFADAMAALEPVIQVRQAMPREQILKLATELASAVWTLRVRADAKQK